MVKICSLPGHHSFWGPAALFITWSFASEALLTAEMVFSSMTPCPDPWFAQSQPQTSCLVSVAHSSQTFILILRIPTFGQVSAGAAAPRVACGGDQGRCELSRTLAAAGAAPSTTGEPGGICRVALDVLPLCTHGAIRIDF